MGGKVELRWRVAPREPSGEDTKEEEEVRRLSEFCCETLRLGGCRKGEGKGGLATDTLPDPDMLRKEVHKVRTW